MRRGTALICLLVISLLSVQVSAATDVRVADVIRSAVEACISRLDLQTDIGYERIAARCPDLMRQLERSDWAAWLPSQWNEPGNDLSAGGLKELAELGTRETAIASRGAIPDVRGVPAVVTRLAPRSEGVWERFKAWLRSLTESRQREPAESWYSRLLSGVATSEATLELTSYLALACVVALAGMIVLGEMHSAGLLARRDTTAHAGRVARAVQPPQPLSWSDFENAAWDEQPRVLLDMLVNRLGERQDLPPASALTVRELARAARMGEADRSRLLDLALTTERLRYSTQSVKREELQGPLAGGRALLRRLAERT